MKEDFPGFHTAPREAFRNYFAHLPVIETRRLILRKLRMKDAKDLFEWTSDPDVARYVLWDAHTSLRDTRAFLRYARSCYHHGAPASWGIELRDTGKVIGTIGVIWYSPENSSCEIGYSMSREYWNRGIMTEAARAVIDSLFRSLPLNRIEAQHDPRNPASGRVLLKCGMKKEGVLRQRLKNKGEMVDVALWSLLCEEHQPAH